MLKKGSKIQDSTPFDRTKLDFYLVENAVETVNNYYPGGKLCLLWKPYTILLFMISTIFHAFTGGESNAFACESSS
jgi:hypothetical protein